MNWFALVRSHANLQLASLFRTPAYVIPTVGFPALFFVLFDLPYARLRPEAANETTLAFIAFAIVGVTLFQFGVGIAQDRGRPWERYLRTLPVSPAVRFSARIVAAMVFGLLTAAIVAGAARALTPIDLSVAGWLWVLVYGSIGGIPFVLMGITIGYWATARSAVPIATACNLLLAYAGGLWMPPQFLPAVVQHVSPWLPTRQFADLLWSVASGHGAERALWGLALYTIGFGVLASIGYRRDERTRYA